MYGAKRLNDDYDAGQPHLLHAHSVDAAQEGFYKACNIAKMCRAFGLEKVRYPYKRKLYRTTVWKHSGIRLVDGQLVLTMARGLASLVVPLPPHLSHLLSDDCRELRLVWNAASRHYEWHLVIDDKQPSAQPPGENIAAVDLGEIHPAVVTDGQEAVVFSARALRAVRQYTNKRLAFIQARQARMHRGSRRWKKLQHRKNRFLAQQEHRTRDIEHKVSRAIVDWAVERQISTLAIGDVRDVANGKRLNRKSQQKISNWSHGKLEAYIDYKAEVAGISVEAVSEAYSSQTCPACGHRHKPRGRIYQCTNPTCGLVAHRDVVGAANLLSRFVCGELAQVYPPPEKYRYPFNATGKRSPPDTGPSGSHKRETTPL